MLLITSNLGATQPSMVWSVRPVASVIGLLYADGHRAAATLSSVICSQSRSPARLDRPVRCVGLVVASTAPKSDRRHHRDRRGFRPPAGAIVVVTDVEGHVMRRWHRKNLILGALLVLATAAVTLGVFGLFGWLGW